MIEAILKDLQQIIDDISYGDITRNSLESRLESTKVDIQEQLKDNDDD